MSNYNSDLIKHAREAIETGNEIDYYRCRDLKTIIKSLRKIGYFNANENISKVENSQKIAKEFEKGFQLMQHSNGSLALIGYRNVAWNQNDTRQLFCVHIIGKNKLK